ncbi:MAG TPA: 2-amino-4-hydroxy-6-hydroxymethyldihydropteridine diphosphokinase [Lichenihabitans sp.]|jgi:2-amino-4-hydroxy-6-hydroxymethyldihydropteridine diphosphokinase|nr:2-amino-4-hydroxy-6-hydroxymethyldihydropteridine diphosphokinase [Lichenihabitans sp.]
MNGQPREVALALGSNVGDKAAHIGRALAALTATGLVRDLEASALYRTAPWGPVAQDWYVNGCAVGMTMVPPRDLLARVKALEVALGRVETVRWGPRVIDIDILYYVDEAIDTPALTLPHPEMLKRAFVLIPLAELRPERRIGGIAVADAAARCDPHGIERLA